MTDPKIQHILALAMGAVLLAWIAAHVVLVVFVTGGLVGYVVGRRHGRHRAVLDAARRIVEERARVLGGLWPSRDAGGTYLY